MKRPKSETLPRQGQRIGDRLECTVSRLPRNYRTGILISLVYLFLLASLSVLVYLRRMKGLDKKSLQRFGKEDLVFTDGKGKEFARGAFSEFGVHGTSFRDMLFQVFSGYGPQFVKNGLRLNVRLETNNLCQTGSRVPFFYLYNAALLPSALKVKDLLTDAGILSGMTPTELKTLQEQEEIKPLLLKNTIWTFTAAADYNIMKVNGLL
jgi:hypothetical protein